jgi:hypothetical protein
MASIVVACAAPSLAALESSSPFPGLELVDSKNVDKLYRRPDVDASAYAKVLIGEPVVEFSKNWNPRNYGSFGISASQLNKIRTDLAALAKSTFAKVLGDGGYEIVTEAGDGVLAVTPNIVNLYISAPDIPTAGRSKTYVMDAGSMTLVLPVSDAVTGTLLAVAYDHQRAGQSATLRWATSVSNRAAAEATLKGWAEQLRRELDAARGK